MWLISFLTLFWPPSSLFIYGRGKREIWMLVGHIFSQCTMVSVEENMWPFGWMSYLKNRMRNRRSNAVAWIVFKVYSITFLLKKKPLHVQRFVTYFIAWVLCSPVKITSVLPYLLFLRPLKKGWNAPGQGENLILPSLPGPRRTSAEQTHFSFLTQSLK